RRRALLLAAVVGTMAVTAAVVLQLATRGWFWTYTFGLHQRHDFDLWLGFVLAPLRVLLLLGPAVALAPLALALRSPASDAALRVGYDPRAFVPTAADRRQGDLLIARLRAASGPVFVPFHPFYARRAGKTPSLHAMNLADVNAIPGLGTPRDLVEAITSRAFA